MSVADRQTPGRGHAAGHVQWLDGLLRLLAAAALLYSGYVHWHLRHGYDAIRTSVLSQGTVFSVQAIVCLVLAVVVLVGIPRPARRRSSQWEPLVVWLLVLLTAAGSLTAVLVYRYVDVGRVGVLPNMYEPSWYPMKTYSAVADGIATVCSLTALGIAMTTRRRGA